MPFRQTYQIYRERKAAQREQSFRCCLIILIVFIFLSLILLLARIPWGTQGKNKELSTVADTTQTILRTESSAEITTTPNTPTASDTKSETPSTSQTTLKTKSTAGITTTPFTNQTTPNTPTASDTKSETPSTSQTTLRTESTAGITTTPLTNQTTSNTPTASDTKSETPSTNQTTLRTESTAGITTTLPPSQAKYSKQHENRTEEITNLSTNKTTNETILYSPQNRTASTVESASMNKINESSSKTPINESHSVEEIHFNSTEREEDAETTTTKTTEQTSKKNVESTMQSSVTDINDNRNSTDINETSQTTLASDAITRENATRDSYSQHNYTPFSDEKFSTMNETNEKYTTNVITSTTETSTSFNKLTTTIAPISYERNFSSTATTDKNTNNICNTSYCKQIASKMISYMNDSADPCNDFYEYACGGFETNPLLIDVDQARRISNYERIEKQMIKENLTFAIYYKSCVKYERTVSLSERIKMARDALERVGKFYINDTCSADSANFTDLFVKLIQHHSAFLFDVVPEVDEYHPNSFTLKIGPTSYESPFKTEYEEDSCFENDFKIFVDFEALYRRYKTCKKQDEKDEIRKSVSDALVILKVFENLNDTNLELERINKTINVIDSVIMQGYFSHFPSKSDARKAYLENNYTSISLKKLHEKDNSAFINWTLLIESLTNTDKIINKDIQVYFLDSMVKGLQKLKESAERNCTNLHNAIMALYARKLYQELVMPRQNAKAHCLRVATYLLRPEATNLYLSSFADHEIERMNNRTTYMFNELKQTLKKKINVTLPEGNGKKASDKTDSLELALPPVSYFKNKELLYSDYNMAQNLSKNYFDNSINLMKRYRTLMYTEIRREFKISEQIWTYYATPFQSQIKTIYGLNQIVIPYGIIDWTAINNEDSLNYISLATLGNTIALQIANHFDEPGSYYWNQTRNPKSLFDDLNTNKTFRNCTSDQKENFFNGFMNFILPSTNQNVSLTIPQLAVNKQSSQKTGLKLTYDTLDRMRSKVQEEDLPWMNFHIDKLFYLAYAQTYCTRTPLTSSYVDLHESEDLPSRILIFITMFKNTLVDSAWDCQKDQYDPKNTCSVYPDI
nr:PREDICTED: endothelin-converting enzyme 1-like isoform X2 [Linepithema humile]